MNPVITDQDEPFVVVGVDNRFMLWKDGRLTGDTALVKKAYSLARERTVVELPESKKWVRACFSDPRNCAGAIAAMLGVNLQRARIVQADRGSWMRFNEKLMAPMLSI